MRAVVQRVTSASVTVEGRAIARMGAGLLVFLGIEQGDDQSDLEYVAGKVHDLRIFADEQGKMNRSVTDAGASVLVVSQFTLSADCRHGRRPSFDAAAPPAVARAMYEAFVSLLRSTDLPVQTGEFQAMMQVELTNDGPVTILLD
ncbi:MAG: D-aminoacyl-tRNA deacylase, partial [Vicinamibacterales bacterium]